jgi:hypothetical protein
MGRPTNRSKNQSEAMKRYWKRRKASEALPASSFYPKRGTIHPKRVLKAMETLKVYLSA